MQAEDSNGTKTLCQSGLARVAEWNSRPTRVLERREIGNNQRGPNRPLRNGSGSTCGTAGPSLVRTRFWPQVTFRCDCPFTSTSSRLHPAAGRSSDRSCGSRDQGTSGRFFIVPRRLNPHGAWPYTALDPATGSPGPDDGGICTNQRFPVRFSACLLRHRVPRRDDLLADLVDLGTGLNRQSPSRCP